MVSEAEEDEVLGVSGMATVALATTEGDRNAVSVGHLIINMPDCPTQTDSSSSDFFFFIGWRMIDVRMMGKLQHIRQAEVCRHSEVYN